MRLERFFELLYTQASNGRSGTRIEFDRFAVVRDTEAELGPSTDSTWYLISANESPMI